MWRIKDVLGGKLKNKVTSLKVLLPCQMMETPNMVLSCVDLVKMDKILDT